MILAFFGQTHAPVPDPRAHLTTLAAEPFDISPGFGEPRYGSEDSLAGC
jgi:hypothetical protein